MLKENFGYITETWEMWNIFVVWKAIGLDPSLRLGSNLKP